MEESLSLSTWPVVRELKIPKVTTDKDDYKALKLTKGNLFF